MKLKIKLGRKQHCYVDEISVKVGKFIYAERDNYGHFKLGNNTPQNNVSIYSIDEVLECIAALMALHEEALKDSQPRSKRKPK